MILAIDDDPDRYDGLRSYLGSRIKLRVGACQPCIHPALWSARAVLLDYDLDGASDCACGRPLERGRKGIDPAIVEALALRGRPVIITSCSSPANVRALSEALRVQGLTVAEHPAIEPECELRWIGRLWSWGVL